MLENAYNTSSIKSFYAPTRIWSGEGVTAKLPDVLPPGARLVVADARFQSDEIMRVWDPAHICVVEREPFEADVHAALAAIKDTEFAVVITLGGGSTIDFGKALHAQLTFGTLNIRDRARPLNGPALVAVPTTAGSGSETSRFFILNDADGGKRARRAWSFAPDLAVLDPKWLTNMSRDGLILGAFDAFCHLWETYVCRNERSATTEMLALSGIPKIAATLGKIVSNKVLTHEERANLQEASALGGMAISNVRTGMIHTMGESLSPLSHLAHPQTLWVFYRAVRESYRIAIPNLIARMDHALGGNGGLHRLDQLWQTAFETTGMSAMIGAKLTQNAPDLDRLMGSVMRDQVLLKENPAPVTWDEVHAVAAQALASWRRAA